MSTFSMTDIMTKVGRNLETEDAKLEVTSDELVNVLKTNPDGTKSLKVYNIDRAVNVIDMHMSEKLNQVYLASNTTVGATTLTVQAGHGFVLGDFIEIWQELTPNFVAYNQTEIINVNGNILTLEIPMDNPFTTSAICYRTNIKMNVNGSVTPRYFTFEPKAGSYRITNLTIYMAHSQAGDDSKFGSIPALTNGVYFRKTSGIVNKNLYNVNNNGEFRERNDSLEYTDKAGAGVYGTTVSKNFDRNTVAVSVGKGEAIQVCVRDNLTGLISFKMVIQGYDANDNLVF